MDVFAAAPFAVGSIAWQSLPGQWALTIVCKATFSLAPGTCALASERDDITEVDNYWDDDAARSVYAPSDLAPQKTQPEVMIVGSAFAPHGDALRSLVARVQVGSVDKAIEVIAPRTLMRDGAIREGAPWKQMPLLYERAGGGAGTWNPVGMSPASLDRHGRRTLPNLQAPGTFFDDRGARGPTGAPQTSTTSSKDESVTPIGFGPIAGSWGVRRDKLGEREAEWTDSNWVETALSGTFDLTYFQAAPADQWLDELKADQAFTLENLHAEHPRLSTRLPGILPRVRVETPDSRPWVPTMVADTLWVDTNRSICTVTWRGRVPIGIRKRAGRITVGVEDQGRVVWPNVPESTGLHSFDAEALHTAVDDEAVAILDSRVASGEALPFRSSANTADASGGAMSAASSGTLPAALAFQSRQSRPSLPHSRGQGSGGWSNNHTTEEGPSPPSQASLPPWLHNPQRAPSTPPSARGPVAPPPLVPMMMRTQPARSAGETTSPVPLPMPPPPPNLAPLSEVSQPRPPYRPPPPPLERVALGSVNERSLSSASYAGVLHASNAAASSASAAPASALSAQSDAKNNARRDLPGSGVYSSTLQELVWFDAKIIEMVRSKRDWEHLLPPPSPARPKTETPPSKAAEEEDAARTARDNRATIVRVLAGAAQAPDVDAAVLDAISEDGSFAPPCIVVAGELETQFDEIETLKILTLAAPPLAPGDKRLKDLIDLSAEVMKTPLGGSPEVAAGFVGRIREAWSKANRSLPPDYLDHHAKRLLLDQRLYQKRQLRDQEWIRALITPVGSSSAIPAYLPIGIATWMPLFARFTARVIAIAVPQQDQSETVQVALFVSALSRVVTPKMRAR